MGRKGKTTQWKQGKSMRKLAISYNGAKRATLDLQKVIAYLQERNWAEKGSSELCSEVDKRLAMEFMRHGPNV